MNRASGPSTDDALVSATKAATSGSPLASIGGDVAVQPAMRIATIDSSAARGGSGGSSIGNCTLQQGASRRLERFSHVPEHGVKQDGSRKLAWAPACRQVRHLSI